jgi:succinate dehydrogenase / fumarate reductase flavoprotein subunit
MLLLARVVTLGALARDESRGAHYKPDFPERDDANWLKTTRASLQDGKIELKYEPVDVGLIPLRKRSYTATK